MDELSLYVRAVRSAARAQGRHRVGGIRFSARGERMRVDAELLSFAGRGPQEEHVIIVQGEGRPLLLLHTLPDLASRLEDLGGEPDGL